MNAEAISRFYQDMEFRNFVKTEELPKDIGVVYAAITDDMLDLDDFNYYRLYIEKGVVINQIVLFDSGVYELVDFKGMTMEKLAKWSQVDNTGRSPEVRYELSTMFVR